MPTLEPPAAETALDFATFRRLDLAALVREAEAQGIAGASGLRRAEILRRLLDVRARRAEPLSMSGVLEAVREGYGFLRQPDTGYAVEPDDVYVSPSQIRRFSLRTGDVIHGIVRSPRHAERFYSFSRILSVNGLDPEAARERILLTISRPSTRSAACASRRRPTT
jgi:transcription termination factor Rho